MTSPISHHLMIYKEVERLHLNALLHCSYTRQLRHKYLFGQIIGVILIGLFSMRLIWVVQSQKPIEVLHFSATNCKWLPEWSKQYIFYWEPRCYNIDILAKSPLSDGSSNTLIILNLSCLMSRFRFI